MADHSTRNIWELLGQVGNDKSDVPPVCEPEKPAATAEPQQQHVDKEGDVSGQSSSRKGLLKESGTPQKKNVTTRSGRKATAITRQRVARATKFKATAHDLTRKGAKPKLAARESLKLPSLDKLRTKLRITKTNKVKSPKKSPVAATKPSKSSSKMMSVNSLNIFDRAKGFMGGLPCDPALNDISVNARDSPSLSCIAPLDLSKASQTLKVPLLGKKADVETVGATEGPLDLSVRKRVGEEPVSPSPVKRLALTVDSRRVETAPRPADNVSVVKPLSDRTSIFPKPAHTNTDSLRRSPCAALNAPFSSGKWAPVIPLVSEKGTPSVVNVRGKTVKVSPVRPQIKGRPVGEVQPNPINRQCISDIVKPLKDKTDSSPESNLSRTCDSSLCSRGGSRIATAVCKPLTKDGDPVVETNNNCTLSGFTSLSNGGVPHASAFRPLQTSPVTTVTSPHTDSNHLNSDHATVTHSSTSAKSKTGRSGNIHSSQVLNVPTYNPSRTKPEYKITLATKRRASQSKTSDRPPGRQLCTKDTVVSTSEGSSSVPSASVGSPGETQNRSNPDVKPVNISDDSDMISVYISNAQLAQTIISRSQSIIRSSSRNKSNDSSYQNVKCDNSKDVAESSADICQTNGGPLRETDISETVHQDTSVYTPSVGVAGNIETETELTCSTVKTPSVEMANDQCSDKKPSQKEQNKDTKKAKRRPKLTKKGSETGVSVPSSLTLKIPVELDSTAGSKKADGVCAEVGVLVGKNVSHDKFIVPVLESMATEKAKESLGLAAECTAANTSSSVTAAVNTPSTKQRQISGDFRSPPELAIVSPAVDEGEPAFLAHSPPMPQLSPNMPVGARSIGPTPTCEASHQPVVPNETQNSLQDSCSSSSSSAASSPEAKIVPAKSAAASQDAINSASPKLSPKKRSPKKSPKLDKVISRCISNLNQIAQEQKAQYETHQDESDQSKNATVADEDVETSFEITYSEPVEDEKAGAVDESGSSDMEIMVVDQNDDDHILPDIPSHPPAQQARGRRRNKPEKSRTSHIEMDTPFKATVQKFLRMDKSPKRSKSPRNRSPKSARSSPENVYSIKYQNGSPLKATFSKSLSFSGELEEHIEPKTDPTPVPKKRGISRAISFTETRTKNSSESERHSSHARRNTWKSTAKLSAFIPTEYHDFTPISWPILSAGKHVNLQFSPEKDISQTRYYQTTILKQFVLDEDESLDPKLCKPDETSPLKVGESPTKPTENTSPEKTTKVEAAGASPVAKPDIQNSPSKTRRGRSAMSPAAATKHPPNSTDSLTPDKQKSDVCDNDKPSPKKTPPKKNEWKAELDQYKRNTRVPEKLIYIPKSLPKGYTKAVKQLEETKKKQQKQEIPLVACSKEPTVEKNPPHQIIRPSPEYFPPLPTQMHCVPNKELPLRLKLCSSPARTPESSPQAKVRTSPDAPLKLTFNLNPGPDDVIEVPPSSLTNITSEDESDEKLSSDKRDRSPIKLKLKLQHQRNNRLKAFVTKKHEIKTLGSRQDPGKVTERTGDQSVNQPSERNKSHLDIVNNNKERSTKTSETSTKSRHSQILEKYRKRADSPRRPKGSSSPRRKFSKKKRKFPKSRMLEELRNTDGYIAEKRWKKNEDLFVDPSQLTREERALQRAIIRFTEMELKANQKKTDPSDADSACGVAPAVPSMISANRKAGQLKRRALKQSRAAFKKGGNTFVDFQPIILPYRTRKAAEKAAEDRKLGNTTTTSTRKRGSRASGKISNDEPTDASVEAMHELPTIKPIRRRRKQWRLFRNVRRNHNRVRNWTLAAANSVAGNNETVSQDLGYDSPADVTSPRVVLENAETGDVIDRLDQQSSFGDTESIISDVTVTSSQDDIPPEVRRMNVRMAIGETVLHRMARLGYEEAAIWCAKTSYVNVNSQDNAGFTPLHEAAGNGHMNIARHLLEAGANINLGAHDGSTPLHDAVEGDQLEMARLLLSCGADPRLTKYSGMTLLEMVKSQEMEIFVKGHLRDLQGHQQVHSEHSWRFMGSATTDDDVLEEDESPEDTGLAVLAEAPDLDGRQEEVEFTMSDQPLIPIYHLCINESTGAGNYALFSDVTSRAGLSRAEVVQMCGPLCMYTVSADFIRDQLLQSALHTEAEVEGLYAELSTGQQEVVEMNERLMTLLDMSVVGVSAGGVKDKTLDELKQPSRSQALLNLLDSQSLEGMVQDAQIMRNAYLSGTPLEDYHSPEKSQNGDGSIDGRNISPLCTPKHQVTNKCTPCSSPTKRPELERLTSRLSDRLLQSKSSPLDILKTRVDLKKTEVSIPKINGSDQDTGDAVVRDTESRRWYLNPYSGEMEFGRLNDVGQEPVETSDKRTPDIADKDSSKMDIDTNTVVNSNNVNENVCDTELSIGAMDSQEGLGSQDTPGNSVTGLKKEKLPSTSALETNLPADSDELPLSVLGTARIVSPPEISLSVPSDQGTSAPLPSEAAQQATSPAIDRHSSDHQSTCRMLTFEDDSNVSSVADKERTMPVPQSSVDSVSKGTGETSISHISHHDKVLPDDKNPEVCQRDTTVEPKQGLCALLSHKDDHDESAKMTNKQSVDVEPRIDESNSRGKEEQRGCTVEGIKWNAGKPLTPFKWETVATKLDGSNPRGKEEPRGCTLEGIQRNVGKPLTPFQWEVDNTAQGSNSCGHNLAPKDRVIVIVPRYEGTDEDEAETLPYSGDEEGRDLDLDDYPMEDNDNDQPWTDHGAGWDAEEARSAQGTVWGEEALDLSSATTLSADSPYQDRVLDSPAKGAPVPSASSNPRTASASLTSSAGSLREAKTVPVQKSEVASPTFSAANYNPSTNYHSIQSLLNSPPKSQCFLSAVKVLTHSPDKHSSVIRKIARLDSSSKAEVDKELDLRSLKPDPHSLKLDSHSEKLIQTSDRTVIDKLMDFSKKGVDGVFDKDVTDRLEGLKDREEFTLKKELSSSKLKPLSNTIKPHSSPRHPNMIEVLSQPAILPSQPIDMSRSSTEVPRLCVYSPMRLAAGSFSPHLSPLHSAAYCSPPAQMYPGPLPGIPMAYPPHPYSAPGLMTSSPMGSPCALKIVDVHSLQSPSAQALLSHGVFASPPALQSSPMARLASSPRRAPDDPRPSPH